MNRNTSANLTMTESLKIDNEAIWHNAGLIIGIHLLSFVIMLCMEFSDTICRWKESIFDEDEADPEPFKNKVDQNRLVEVFPHIEFIEGEFDSDLLIDQFLKDQKSINDHFRRIKHQRCSTVATTSSSAPNRYSRPLSTARPPMSRFNRGVHFSSASN